MHSCVLHFSHGHKCELFRTLSTVIPFGSSLSLDLAWFSTPVTIFPTFSFVSWRYSCKPNLKQISKQCITIRNRQSYNWVTVLETPPYLTFWFSTFISLFVLLGNFLNCFNNVYNIDSQAFTSILWSNKDILSLLSINSNIPSADAMKISSYLTSRSTWPWVTTAFSLASSFGSWVLDSVTSWGFSASTTEEIAALMSYSRSTVSSAVAPPKCVRMTENSNILHSVPFSNDFFVQKTCFCREFKACSHWSESRLGQGPPINWLYETVWTLSHYNWTRTGAETYFPTLFWSQSLFLSRFWFHSV